MTSHCTYAAHYEKAPKKVNINNFKKDICFGWIGRKHTDTEKHSGVIHYMAIQKNVQYGSFSSTFFGREWEIHDTDPDRPAVLTREHCEFWIALLQQAGFKFAYRDWETPEPPTGSTYPTVLPGSSRRVGQQRCAIHRQRCRQT